MSSKAVPLYHPEVLSSEAWEIAYEIFSGSYNQIGTDISTYVDELNQRQPSPLQQWLCGLFDLQNEGNKLKFILSLFPPAIINHQVILRSLLNNNTATPISQTLKRSVFADPQNADRCTLEFSRLSTSIVDGPRDDLYVLPKRMQFLTLINIDPDGKYKIEELNKEKKFSLEIVRNGDSITHLSHFKDTNQVSNQNAEKNNSKTPQRHSLELSADLFKKQFVASDFSLFGVDNLIPNFAFASNNPWVMTPKILSQNDAMFNKLQVIFTDQYFKTVDSLEEKAVVAHNEGNTNLKDELHGLRYALLRNRHSSLFVRVFYSLLRHWGEYNESENENLEVQNPFLIDVDSILDFENLMLFEIMSTNTFFYQDGGASTHAFILLTHDLKKVLVTQNRETYKFPNRLNFIKSMNERKQNIFELTKNKKTKKNDNIQDSTSSGNNNNNDTIDEDKTDDISQLVKDIDQLSITKTGPSSQLPFNLPVDGNDNDDLEAEYDQFDQFGTPLDLEEDPVIRQKFPGGKISTVNKVQIETGYDAAMREFEEEIGVSLKDFSLIPSSEGPFRNKNLYLVSGGFARPRQVLPLEPDEVPHIEVRKSRDGDHKSHFYYPIVLSDEKQHENLTKNVKFKIDYRLCSNPHYVKSPDWTEVLDIGWPLLSSLNGARSNAFAIAARDCLAQIRGTEPPYQDSGGRGQYQNNQQGERRPYQQQQQQKQPQQHERRPYQQQQQQQQPYQQQQHHERTPDQQNERRPYQPPHQRQQGERGQYHNGTKRANQQGEARGQQYHYHEQSINQPNDQASGDQHGQHQPPQQPQQTQRVQKPPQHQQGQQVQQNQQPRQHQKGRQGRQSQKDPQPKQQKPSQQPSQQPPQQPPQRPKKPSQPQQHRQARKGQHGRQGQQDQQPEQHQSPQPQQHPPQQQQPQQQSQRRQAQKSRPNKQESQTS